MFVVLGSARLTRGDGQVMRTKGWNGTWAHRLCVTGDRLIIWVLQSLAPSESSVTRGMRYPNGLDDPQPIAGTVTGTISRIAVSDGQVNVDRDEYRETPVLTSCT
jgi:hypothetical protein